MSNQISEKPLQEKFKILKKKLKEAREWKDHP